ncbi:MAG TPA: hypothetical protein VKE94_10180, partial [Gemmataceae bacterium]|nr:hypothetical protein [Gemmataceae bacterium]
MLFRSPFARSVAAKKRPSYRPVVEALETRALLSSAANFKHVAVVHLGESIQAAVDGAKPSTEILVEPGTYSQAVV